MYTKSSKSIAEQIELLQNRGLLIADLAAAKLTLANVSYYRLAGYWWPMQDDKAAHTFKPGSRFEDVMALYNFDKALRIILFDVIEVLEISLRTKLIYHLSHEEGPWWFQETSLFSDVREHVKTLANLEEEIERSKDTFIKEHKKKHKDDGRFPPAWKALELTTFGALSRLYGNLKPGVKSKDIIAAEFGTVNHTYLPSWLQSIAQIRNICAHHGRLWNKNLPGRPKLLSKPPAPWLTVVPKEADWFMLYIHLCCMKYLLNAINPENSFTQTLQELLIRFPTVDRNALGMPMEWYREPVWQVGFKK